LSDKPIISKKLSRPFMTKEFLKYRSVGAGQTQEWEGQKKRSAAEDETLFC
jgi:hypothetical protein